MGRMGRGPYGPTLSLPGSRVQAGSRAGSVTEGPGSRVYARVRVCDPKPELCSGWKEMTRTCIRDPLAQVKASVQHWWQCLPLSWHDNSHGNAGVLTL
eukprot:2996557-Rhodomonas_salina.1